MPAPLFVFFENDSTPTGGTIINNVNPINLGLVQKGTITSIVTIHVWNGKNDLTLDTAIAPRLYATNGPGNAAALFNGTALNGFQSMLEARSCGAFNTPADQHQSWIPIKPTNMLQMGDMPTNSMREVELRLNVPIDSPDISLINFSLQVSL